MNGTGLRGPQAPRRRRGRCAARGPVPLATLLRGPKTCPACDFAALLSKRLTTRIERDGYSGAAGPSASPRPLRGPRTRPACDFAVRPEDPSRLRQSPGAAQAPERRSARSNQPSVPVVMIGQAATGRGLQKSCLRGLCSSCESCFSGENCCVGPFAATYLHGVNAFSVPGTLSAHCWL